MAKKNIEQIVEDQSDFDGVFEEQDAAEIEAEDAPVVPEPVGITTRIVVAVDGDSYPVLAAKYAPAGTRVHDYARELAARNNFATIRPGSRVRIH